MAYNFFFFSFKICSVQWCFTTLSRFCNTSCIRIQSILITFAKKKKKWIQAALTSSRQNLLQDQFPIEHQRSYAAHEEGCMLRDTEPSSCNYLQWPCWTCLQGVKSQYTAVCFEEFDLQLQMLSVPFVHMTYYKSCLKAKSVFSVPQKPYFTTYLFCF